MKRVRIQPNSWVYTERMNDLGSDEIISDLKGKRLRGENQDVPLVVMSFEEFPTKYVIVSGNHRALLAKWEHEPLDAVVLETPEDFEAIERERPTNWGQSYSASNVSRYTAARSEILEAAIHQARRANRA
jgi:hypothetical protein